MQVVRILCIPKGNLMHRHKRYRYGPPLFRGPFRGWIWMLLVAFMMFGNKGDWWPGILIVIGAIFVFGSLFRDQRPPEPPPPAPHQPPFDMPPPPPARRADPAPSEPARRPDLLPASCPNCGGPVHSSALRWTSSHSVACSYCGSHIEAKK